MVLSNIILMALVGLLIAVFPAWPYSRNWGYYPSAGVSLVLLASVVYLVSLTV